MSINGCLVPSEKPELWGRYLQELLESRRAAPFHGFEEHFPRLP